MTGVASQFPIISFNIRSCTLHSLRPVSWTARLSPPAKCRCCFQDLEITQMTREERDPLGGCLAEGVAAAGMVQSLLQRDH